MLVEQIDPAGEDEGDGEAGGARRIEVALQVRKQWIVLTTPDEGLKGDIGRHILAIPRDGASVWSVVEVVLLLRNDPTDATARIGHVARIPRDHMEMEMRNGLPRRVPDIQPDIETVRLVILLNHNTSHLNRLQELPLLLYRGPKPTRDVPLWDEKRVPGVDRIGIPDSQDPSTDMKDPVCGRSTKRAISAHPSTATGLGTRSMTSSPE